MSEVSGKNNDKANVLNKMEEANENNNEVFTYNYDMSSKLFNA